MSGVTPYTDQIWIKSDCRKLESEAIRLITSCSSKDVYIKLVDQVPINIANNYQNYRLIVTDNILKNISHYQALWPEFWGTFSYEPEYENSLPTKLFNCFINRTCPIRQSWFYQLTRKNLLNDGYVSFMLDYRKDLAPAELDTNNKIAVYDWVFNQGCEIFVEEHNFMRNYVPYQNFNKSIDDAIIDSKVSVVLETYINHNEIIAFSEKIFRSLQLPRPFLLYSCQGAVEILRSQGFDVYDDIINHSYDTDPDLIQRQIKILNEIENCKEIVYTRDMLDDFERRAQHNRQLLRQLKQQWPDKLKKTLEAIEQHK